MTQTTSVSDIKSGNKPPSQTAQFRDFLEKQKHQIAAALPKHVSPDRMIRLACTEFSKNALLQKCTPVSIFGSIIQASQLGLEIGVIGQAYLVPYRNNKTGQYEAQLIPGYKGLISLARRSGEVSSIETHIVYSNDTFEMELGIDTKVRHVPYLDGDRGVPRLVYGVAKFKDGGHHFEWMPLDEVDRIRKRSKASSNGPWVTDYEQMVRKTLIRRMSNYLPMSVELSNAIQISDATDAGHKATFEGEFVVVDESESHEVADEKDARIEHQQSNTVQPVSIKRTEKVEVGEMSDEEKAAAIERDLAEAQSEGSRGRGRGRLSGFDME